MPPGRTEKYVIWRVCEQFNMKPPNVPTNWDDCDIVTRREMITYYQIREIERAEEENERLISLAKAVRG